MIDTIFYSLQFAALIFFNLLCILGVVAAFIVIGAIVQIKNKTEETLDTAKDAINNAKETMNNVGNTTNDIRDFVGNFGEFFRPKKKPGLADVIASFLRK